MTPDAADLARRAVACPRWRWLRGCPTIREADGQRGVVVQVLTAGAPIIRPEQGLERLRGLNECPDFREMAATGCLFGLVREAWTGWAVELIRENVAPVWGGVNLYEDAPGKGEVVFWSRTDDGWVEALVCALEAAPEAAPSSAPSARFLGANADR